MADTGKTYGPYLGQARFLLDYYDDKPFLDFFVNTLPRGIGQIIFMNNPISGLIMFIGLAATSAWVYSLYVVVGLLSSTLTAMGMSMDRAAIRNGVFGYNGALIGCGLGTFLRVGAVRDTVPIEGFSGCILVILAASVTTLLLSSMKHMAALSLPFNITHLLCLLTVAAGKSTAGWFALAEGVAMLKDVEAGSPDLKREFNYCDGPDGCTGIIYGIFRGVAEIFVSPDWVCGIIVTLGAAVCSPISAIMMILGSIVGVLIGMLFQAPPEAVQMGLWSYNSVLGAMCIGGIFYRFTAKSVFNALMCAAICSACGGAFAWAFAATMYTPSLTFPFCLVMQMYFRLDIKERIPMDEVTTAEEHLSKNPNEWCGITYCFDGGRKPVKQTTTYEDIEKQESH